MANQLDEIQQLASKLALDVGLRIRKALDGRESMEVSFKGDNDVVTDIDVWAEEQIVTGVNNSFPDHIILGEESTLADTLSESDYSKEVCWIVDPIDGTSNFVNRIPHVCVSIGVLIDGVRQVGIVYDAGGDVLYSAIRGRGAFANSKAIDVSVRDSISKSLIATGYPHSRIKDWPALEPVYHSLFERARDVRIFGAAALDQCWVASGKIEAFFEMGLKPWDVAAGGLIVEEAGGTIGNPLGHERSSKFSCFSTSYLFSCSDEVYTSIAECLPD